MSNQYRHIENLNNTQSLLESAVFELIDQLSSDPTPESDSAHDPVWQWLENREDDSVQLELNDISSRFNLNFVRTKMLEESEFGSLMIDSHTPEELKLYRVEWGFASDLHKAYGTYYKEEDLDRFFTIYSYANLNVSYEDSLKKLYESRVSDTGSQNFLAKVQKLISEQEMADESRMNTMLGGNRDKLYPLINIESLINVNFAEERILNAVLSYPYGGESHKNGSDYLEILTAERTTMELTPDRLQSLFQLEDHYLRIPQYLGCKTWFWKITAELNDHELNVIICRVPDREADEGLFQIIEWKFNS